MIRYVFYLGLLCMVSSCSSSQLSKLNKTYDVSKEALCVEKKGYWYKGKCWAHYKAFDDGIPLTEIDQVVSEQIARASNYTIRFNNNTYPIAFFISEQAENKTYFLGTFYDGQQKNSFMIQCKGKPKTKRFKALGTIISGNIFSDTMAGLSQQAMEKSIMATGTVYGKGAFQNENEYYFTGVLNNVHTNQPAPFSITLGETLFAMGDSTIKIEGQEAYLNGTLGTKTYQQINDLIKSYPEVHTLIFEQVPGSVNDAVNMHTGRLIREANLTTVLRSTSVIASGGVDLFCAGKKRTIARGALLGIHSWGGQGISGNDFPKDHPIHQYQLAYFTMCLGPDIGPAFYFRTLAAAPANGMHWMSNAEIAKWNLETTQSVN